MVKEDKIQHLSPREHVRLRPGMYISSVDNPNHLMIETFANALDMHNAGYGDTITISIDKNNVCTCKDEGTGFAINQISPENNETVLQMAFDLMNSSGKYDSEGFYEGSSLGANGVGIKAVNFLSEWLDVISWNNGQFEKLHFEQGILKNRETGKYKDNSSGTIVSYLPDKEIFDTIKTDINYFKKFFNEITYLCNTLTIVFNDETIHHDTIEDSIQEKIGTDIEIVSNRLLIKNDKLNLVMTYGSTNSAAITSYVNYGATNGGPHITIVKSIITRALNKFAKENGILKAKDKNLEGAALQEGLILVYNYISTDVVYDSQSKQRITKIDTSILSSSFSEALEVYLDNNPDDAKIIIEKALVARKAAEAAKKARERVRNNATKQTKKKKFMDMPSKLADCFEKDRSLCELYLTEGDSASGGCKTIRDASTQAIMGLRGKILNTLTSTPDSWHKNQEIMNIVQALGLSWSSDGKSVIYQEDKLRYNKFVIAADRDPDGSHIQTLILTMVWTLFPDLIINGHVYIALPPLYKAEWGTKYQYLDNKKALDNFKKTHTGFTLTYFKGLGEASPEELGAMIMDPETRNIQKVEVENIEEFDKMINNLMGKSSIPKKEFVFNREVREVL